MPVQGAWRWLAGVVAILSLLWLAEGVMVPAVLHAAAEEVGVHHEVGGQVEGGEAAAHEEGEHEGLTHTQIMNFVWHCLNFTLLVVILVKFLKQPITEALRGRQEEVRAAFEELERSKAEAERKYAEYERKLANMEEEAERIRRSFIEQGKAEKERIIAQAQEAAERIKAQAELFIQQELVKAKRELQAEMADMAVKMAEELIKKNITDEDHERLIDDYLAKLEAKS